MGSGFSKMKKQAKLMEQQLEAMRQEQKTKRYTASSGNGLVTLILNGEKELIEIKIKPECIDPNDLEGLQDLIKDAHQQACRQIDSEASSQMPFPGNLF